MRRTASRRGLCTSGRTRLCTSTNTPTAVPGWLAAHAPAEWYERYAARASDYRLPQATEQREALAATIGADGFCVWEAITASDSADWLVELPAVQILRQVWVQQYYRHGSVIRWRGKGQLPPAALMINSPYDVDARYGVKRGMGWHGYTAHLTETCTAQAPQRVRPRTRHAPVPLPGQSKAHLQHVFTAIAVNIERLSSLPSSGEAARPGGRPPSKISWTGMQSLG